jgi:hypothetical protein
LKTQVICDEAFGIGIRAGSSIDPQDRQVSKSWFQPETRNKLYMEGIKFIEWSSARHDDMVNIDKLSKESYVKKIHYQRIYCFQGARSRSIGALVRIHRDHLRVQDCVRIIFTIGGAIGIH